MPVDYQRDAGDSLWRLHDKMILKNSWVTDLRNEVLCFFEARRWARRLPMREGIDPDGSPVRGNSNNHCGI
jgi:hypothetical protein